MPNLIYAIVILIYLFIMKFVQLGTQIKTRCEKKKIYKNTQKYIIRQSSVPHGVITDVARMVCGAGSV